MTDPQRECPNKLIVEGHDDKHSIIHLMRAHIPWTDPPPVWIVCGWSADQILVRGYLTAQIKVQTTRVLGVIFDADTSPRGRYGRVRESCRSLFPDIPEELPAEGLIVDNENGKRLGVWIMPDNASEGTLETFLKCLVPRDAEPVWKHAVASVEAAKALGARCRDRHEEKAQLYTWLAWQDPPGQSPGFALTRKVLDPTSEHAALFVRWFRELYRL
jgi:hypothetical protein